MNAYPEEMLDDIKAGRLTPADVILYSVIRKLCFREGSCWAKLDTLAEYSGLSFMTVRRSLERLGQADWLNIEARPGKPHLIERDTKRDPVQKEHPDPVQNGRGTKKNTHPVQNEHPTLFKKNTTYKDERHKIEGKRRKGKSSSLRSEDAQPKKSKAASRRKRSSRKEKKGSAQKKERETMTAGQLVNQCIKAWCDEYKAEHGKSPQVTGQHTGNMKTLLTMLRRELQLEARPENRPILLQAFKDMQRKTRHLPKWWRDNWTPTIQMSKFNELLIELKGGDQYRKDQLDIEIQKFVNQTSRT